MCQTGKCARILHVLFLKYVITNILQCLGWGGRGRLKIYSTLFWNRSGASYVKLLFMFIRRKYVVFKDNIFIFLTEQLHHHYLSELSLVEEIIDLFVFTLTCITISCCGKLFIVKCFKFVSRHTSQAFFQCFQKLVFYTLNVLLYQIKWENFNYSFKLKISLEFLIHQFKNALVNNMQSVSFAFSFNIQITAHLVEITVIVVDSV